jgi:hypothetical protein
MDNPSLRFVKALIEEVLTVCRWDDTGVTLDLVEPAYRAAIEIGMSEDDIKEIVGDEDA